MSNPITVLVDFVHRLEEAGIDYMLTGSMARNTYAFPRLTMDIDIVAAIVLRDVERLVSVLPETLFYCSPESIREAILNQSCFNLIHLPTLIKIDVMIRKREEFRLLEFTRRQKRILQDVPVWVVSKEDLILSKLDWAKDSESTKQMEDVKLLLDGGCDLAYLEVWAERLQLTSILTRATR